MEASTTAIALSGCPQLHWLARSCEPFAAPIPSQQWLPTLDTQDVGGSSLSPPIQQSPVVVGDTGLGRASCEMAGCFWRSGVAAPAARRTFD
jgi:hypothetical protein